jgi:histidine triad (HIT) family protein
VEDCVFCKIARGAEKTNRIYEDKDVMAILDARPVNEGHTLVMPKKHYENIFEVPDEELAGLFKVVKRVAAAIMNAEKAEGMRIVQNNGSAAHQVIFHLHVHIIPEYEGQESHRFRDTPSQNELERVATKIRKLV